MKPYYDDGKGIVIYHGDCREIMPQLPRVDLVLTDPPYGIEQDCGMGGGGWDSTGRWRRKPRQHLGGWDDEPPTRDELRLVILCAEKSIIWGGNYLPLDIGGKWLVWNKEQVMPTYSDAELAWTNLPGVSVKLYTLHCNRARVEQGLHPTQKPAELMAWCLSLVPDANTILDPYTGSGTILRAAKDLGRKAIGIEIEERYCEIAARRLSQEVFAFK